MGWRLFMRAMMQLTDELKSPSKDGESQFCLPLIHEPPSKSVNCSENTMEIDLTEADNEVRIEENHGAEVLESQMFKVDTDLLPPQKSAGDEAVHRTELHNYTFMNDSIIGSAEDGEDMVIPCSIPTAVVELTEKEANVYTDKIVTEIELPELFVFFKEDSCHVVKDICIDDGVPSRDRILVEIGGLDRKSVTGFPHSDSDGDIDLTKKKVNGIPVLSGLKSLVLDGKIISNEDKEVSKQLSPGSLLNEGADDFDSTNETQNDFSDERLTSDKSVLVQELDAENSEGYHPKDNQVSSEESTSIVPHAAEESESNHAMELHFNSKMESENITFDFDSSAPATSGRDEHRENADGQQSAEALIEPGLQVGTLEGLSTSTRSLFSQLGHGESSFSEVAFSGRIPYSGSIPFSGSISLRSESSTTSTRSFAFPILHSEWNSSPVKMAKADRKLYRKHRGWWRLGDLFCCRF